MQATRGRVQVVALFVLLALLVGCGAESDAPRPTGPVMPPPPRAPVSPPAGSPSTAPIPPLAISGVPSTLVEGMEITPGLVTYPPQVPLPVARMWRSSDPAVLTVSAGAVPAPIVTAVAPGTAELIVETPLHTARLAITVVARPAGSVWPGNRELSVTGVMFLRIGDDSAAIYAPIIIARYGDGTPVTITRLTLTIPGERWVKLCEGARMAGELPRSIIEESYGEWEWLFWTESDFPPGQLFAVRIEAHTAGNDPVVLDATGPVVPGTWPTAYTGTPPVPWQCIG